MCVWGREQERERERCGPWWQTDHFRSYFSRLVVRDDKHLSPNSGCEDEETVCVPHWLIHPIYRFLVSRVLLHFWALAQAKNYLQMARLHHKVTRRRVQVPLNINTITSLPWRRCFLPICFKKFELAALLTRLGMASPGFRDFVCWKICLLCASPSLSQSTLAATGSLGKGYSFSIQRAEAAPARGFGGKPHVLAWGVALQASRNEKTFFAEVVISGPCWLFNCET